jgi:putative transferase (TIGR04331 family)
MKLLLLDRPRDVSILNGREVEFFGPWAQPIQLPVDLVAPKLEPYPTPESVYEAGMKAMNMAHNLLEQLGRIMPSLTGVNTGKRFWGILLGHHVISLTGIIQDIITRHQALPEKDYILGLPYDDNHIRENIPYSWSDAMELIFFDDCFRWHAMGLYLKRYYGNYELIAYSNFPRKRIAESLNELITTTPQKYLKWLYKKVNSTLLGSQRHKEPSTLPNNHSLIWDRYQLSNFDFTKLGATFLSEEFIPHVRSLPYFSVDTEKRKNIKNSLPQPYGELLSVSLPVMAVEGLSSLVNLIEANKRQRFEKIKNIYTHGQGFTDEEPKRALLALLADHGKKIVSIQHGGGATYYAHSGIFLDKVIADEYISWGPGYSDYNETADSNQTKFLPSIYLTHLKQNRQGNKKRKWDVLFVVLEEGRYIKWLYSPLFPDMAHDYFTREKVLFDYFCMEKAAVKVYPETYGWGQADWIRAKYPAAKLLIGGRFVDYALQSRIVIVDYNSTAFLEMLALGRPFLSTWNRRWFRGNNLFEKYIDNLIDLGVFYEQPEALVESYSKIISPDIELWWNESKRQRVLKEMANNFALTSENAYEEWKEEFRRN